MPTFRTPDVYVREIRVFPPSVAEVESAVPVFIGYTEKAKKDVEHDLVLKPTLIYSMTEFEQYFGKAQVPTIGVTVKTREDGGKVGEVTSVAGMEYLLHPSVKMYYENGGGKCYIVSVGRYQATPAFQLTGTATSPVETRYGLEDGLTAAGKEDEPTLLVVPEAVRLTYPLYKDLAGKMLKQCFDLGDRFAILDVYNGDQPLSAEVEVDASTTPATKAPLIAASRGGWDGTLDFLKHGAAYYPFLRTTMNPPIDETKVNVTEGTVTATLASLKTTKTESYNAAKAVLANIFVVVPPSGPVTGVYAFTDTARGVWKAPANVPLRGVIAPLQKIDAEQQGPLNIDPDSGKSVNALRAFAAKGTLVWGARTLAGNDNEWRYINVRRFFTMVEESVKKSTYWAVFESNDANTWVKVRGMIEAYLTQKWREGALAGATPKDAFFVRCGLGTTMDAQDILEGRMNVEIGMAVVRPAEFIILKFSHKMQTS
jgi:uncharacterized protein